MKLFFMGFLQVFFVALSTYFISVLFYPGIIATSFLISFIWSYNVKRVAFGTMRERIIYSSGAALGAAVGVTIAQLIKAPL